MKTAEYLIEDKLKELYNVPIDEAGRLLNVTVNTTRCSGVRDISGNLIRLEYVKLEQSLPYDGAIPNFLLDRFMRIVKKSAEATSVKSMFQSIANEYDSIHDYFLTMTESANIDVSYTGDQQSGSDNNRITMGFVVMRELYDIPYDRWFKRNLR